MSLINMWKLEKTFERGGYLAQGLLRGKRIKSYWWSSRKNFGDLLTPRLLLAYGYTPVYTKKNQASLVATGSILDGLRNDYNGVVLGSGLIRDTELTLPHANVLAVRGRLTRERLGLSQSTLLGDPGLLAAKFLSPRVKKKYRLGIIPHYADKSSSVIIELKQRYGAQCVIINPEQYPEAVINRVAECEGILSSSLHGIIVSHALNIPATWLSISDSVAGDGFKFLDYASSVDIELSPIGIEGIESIDDLFDVSSLPDPGVIEDRINNLDKIFRSLDFLIE